MADPKNPKPKLPDLTQADLTRLLDGAAALSKSAVAIDISAATRHWTDAARAVRMAEQHLAPGKELMRHMDDMLRLQKQWEASPISKMMADLAAHKTRLDLFGATNRDLLGTAALKALPDWTNLQATAKFALPDRDMARTASFLGEATRFQEAWKALGIGESAITSKALLAGLVPAPGIVDQLTRSLAHTVDPFGGAFKSAALWQGSLAARMATIDAARSGIIVRA